MALTVRRAQLADRAAIVSLLTTPVAGTSPLQELQADWGPDALAGMTLATLAELIQDGQIQVAVAIDDMGVLRGFIVFAFVPVHALPGVTDSGWACVLIVTDKSLALADRLATASAMIRVSAAAAAVSMGDPYIYGDIKTPGNLDTFCSTRLASVPVTLTMAGGTVVACNRYFGHASQLAQVFP